MATHQDDLPEVDQEAVDALLEQLINGTTPVIHVKADAAVLQGAIKELPDYPGDYRVVEVKDSIRAALIAFVGNADNAEAWNKDKGSVDVDAHPDTPVGWANLLKEMATKSYGQTFWVFVPEQLADPSFLKAAKKPSVGAIIVVIGA